MRVTFGNAKLATVREWRAHTVAWPTLLDHMCCLGVEFETGAQRGNQTPCVVQTCSRSVRLVVGGFGLR
eukprot:7531796-Lingulodinium_polyedra.AAC.1